MNHRIKARPAKRKFGATFGVMFLAWKIIAEALSPPPSPSDWWVLIEPTFMRPPVAVEVPGSECSMFAAAFASGLNVELFSKVNFDAIGVDWEGFCSRALKNASEFFQCLKPEIHRDSDGIVEYIALYSDRPLVVACAITPAFHQKFSDILGPEFVAIIPNRFLVYAFPKLASDFQDYAPMVIRAYKATSYPVSLEVFEVRGDGIMAIGTFQQP